MIGGILLYTSAYLLVAGMDLILSRRLSERRVFLVGLSILAGMSVALLPLKEQLHTAIQPLFSNPLTVAICAAMLLNLIMRIGVSKESAHQVEAGANAFLTVQRFLEQQGRHVGRAAGCDRRRHSGGRPGAGRWWWTRASPRGRWNCAPASTRPTWNVFVIYDGQVLEVPKERPSPEALLGDAQEVAGFAAYLLKGLGDRVTFGRSGGKARITLRFDH